MKKINIIFVILFSCIIAACFDDKGNYDYSEKPQITIEGLEELYSKVAFQDILRIDPEVTSNNPEDQLSYLWTTFPPDYDSYEGIPLPADTIGREKVLEYPVNLKTGKYAIQLRVTNESNGYQVYANTILETRSDFSRGFYLLKDMGDRTELDLHLPNNTVSANLLEKSLGEPLNEKAVSLGINFHYSFIGDESPDYQTTTTLNLCTENNMRVLDLNDMSVIYDHSSMFWGEEAVETPFYMTHCVYGVAYLSSKGCYFSMQAPAWGMMGAGKFGYPGLVDGQNGEYSPNPNAAFCSYSMSLFFFDELKGRFLSNDFNGSVKSFSDLGQSNEVLPYKPNGIPHKLKFFGRDQVGGVATGYAIFEDKNTAGKHYLYKLGFKTNAYYNPIKDVVEINSSSKLNQASLIANNELTDRVIYFVTGNKLYLYNTENYSEVELSPSGFASDEEITYIGHRYWTQDSEDEEYKLNDLTIATYKDGKYKVYMYNILEGKPTGQPNRILTGEGKVLKVHYLSPRMDGDSHSDYPCSHTAL